MSTPNPDSSPEARLAELGLQLPPVPEPAGTYLPAVRTGNLLFVAGHGPLGADGSVILGKLGQDLTVEQGYEAARITAIGMLASMRAELGTLDRVRRIVKVNGMVNATAEFTAHPKVIDGASDLFAEVFGDRGAHARTAVGFISLPFNIAVEVELVAEVAD